MINRVENAISQVVTDFQNNQERFWNERDIHWNLFYHTKQEKVIQESYPTQLIRAEFPTLKKFGDIRPARGHYDLVIINKESYNKPEVQNMKAQSSWEEYLELIELDVAIEIKLWLNRLKLESMRERADWDIQKLTDIPNKVQKAYFLNFVQLDFEREHNKTFYKELREYLETQKKPSLNILCVPSTPSFLLKQKTNWL